MFSPPVQTGGLFFLPLQFGMTWHAVTPAPNELGLWPLPALCPTMPCFGGDALH
jgi:sugar lactone lactonase YvrE